MFVSANQVNAVVGQMWTTLRRVAKSCSRSILTMARTSFAPPAAEGSMGETSE